MGIFVPPDEVFENAPEDPQKRLERHGYDIPNFTGRMIRSPGGEMYAVYGDHPIPRKGLPYPEAMLANAIVKRATLTMFLSFAGLRRGLTGFLESYLENYCNVVTAVYHTCERIPLLKREYYSTTAKGIWTLTETFLWEIGIRKTIFLDRDVGQAYAVEVTLASRVGQILATLFEYDDAYRMPLVDVMSEFTKEEIIKSPRKFLKKAVRILAERSDNSNLVEKFNKVSWLLTLIFWVPKYRRAFKKAFETVDLEQLQYDNSDYYWHLPKAGYDVEGKTLQDRIFMFRGMKEILREEAERDKNAVPE